MKMRFFKVYRSGNNTNFGLRNIFAAVLKASKICNIKSSCIFSALFISVVALSSNALYSNDLYLLEAADSAQADPFLASANPDGGCKYKIVSKIDFDKEIFSELSAILGKPAAADAGSPFAFLGPVVDFYYTDSKLNRSMLLSIIVGCILLVMILYLFFTKESNIFWHICFSCIIGGGAGNLIDRLLHGFVTDYLRFVFIDFPVFNLADCLIVVGCFSLIGYLLADVIREWQSKRCSEKSDE